MSWQKVQEKDHPTPCYLRTTKCRFKTCEDSSEAGEEQPEIWRDGISQFDIPAPRALRLPNKAVNLLQLGLESRFSAPHPRAGRGN